MAKKVPQISAIVCTLNRLNTLRGTLESLIKQDIKNGCYEVVVVDNGSDDGTIEYVNEFSSKHEFIKLVKEEKKGLSSARNKGLECAQGDIVAFIDDDADASSSWLKSILTAFNENPKVEVVGGPVIPSFSTKQPAWITKDKLSYLSALDRGPEARILEKGEEVWGTNMAFRKEVLNRFGGFSAELGRIGKSLLSSEEILIQKLIERNGGKIFYHPDASVIHHIDPSRLTRDWFIKRAFWQGISNARLDILLDNPDKKVSTISSSILNGYGWRDWWVGIRFLVPPTEDGAWEASLGAAYRLGQEVVYRKESSIYDAVGKQVSKVTGLARRIIDGNRPKQAKVVIFGAGSGGELAAKNIQGDFQIIAVSDNNTTKHGSTCFGCPVIKPTAIIELDIDFVVIASAAHKEIYLQLKELKVPQTKILKFEAGRIVNINN